MRPNHLNVIPSQAATLDANGTAVPAEQMICCSAQAVATGTAAGSFKFQASNDIVYPPNLPVNWTDIANATVSVAGSGSYLVPKTDLSYLYVRAAFVSTAAGVQTVAPIADTGVRQVQTVTAVTDVAGSLNSKWFALSSLNKVTKAQKNFYMWFDDGAGVDPAIAGKTGIHVTYSDGDTGTAIATAMRTALNALTNDFVATGAGAAVIITDVAPGLVSVAADGTAATGFTFANTTPGVVSNLNSKYFLLSNGLNTINYYVWMNVDSIGVSPGLAGKTSAAVAFAAGASAGTIGTALATALAALNTSGDFTTSGSTTVSVTNKVAGSFTAAVDVNSGFAIVLTTPTGTISANMVSLGI